MNKKDFDVEAEPRWQTHPTPEPHGEYVDDRLECLAVKVADAWLAWDDATEGTVMQSRLKDELRNAGEAYRAAKEGYVIAKSEVKL